MHKSVEARVMQGGHVIVIINIGKLKKKSNGLPIWKICLNDYNERKKESYGLHMKMTIS
jgi:hypothetical protein